MGVLLQIKHSEGNIITACTTHNDSNSLPKRLQPLNVHKLLGTSFNNQDAGDICTLSTTHLAVAAASRNAQQAMQLKMKMARWWRTRWWLTAEAHRLAARRLCSLDHDTATFQLNTLQPAQPGGLAIHAPAGCSQLTNHITHNDALYLVTSYDYCCPTRTVAA